MRRNNNNGSKDALLARLQRVTDDIETLSQEPRSTQVIEIIARLRKEEALLIRQIDGDDQSDSFNLAQVQYIKDMTQEMMLISRNNRFSMLEYLFEMAFTEASEILRGSRSARLPK